MLSLRERMCSSKGSYDQPYAARMVMNTPTLKCYYKCPFCLRFHVSSKEGGPTPQTLFVASRLVSINSRYAAFVKAGIPQRNIYAKRMRDEYVIMVR